MGMTCNELYEDGKLGAGEYYVKVRDKYTQDRWTGKSWCKYSSIGVDEVLYPVLCYKDVLYLIQWLSSIDLKSSNMEQFDKDAIERSLLLLKTGIPF